MINEFDYENLQKTFKNSEPFSHCIIDNFFEKEIALKLALEFPDYDDALWSIYDNPIENKRASSNWNLFPKTTYQIFSLMNSDVFLEKIKKITGINNLIADYGLHGGGWHMHGRNGKLNIHKDYSIHPKLKMERRINIIMYMTPNWQNEWGGGLEFWSNDEEKKLPKNCIKRISNEFNRAVIFDTTQNSWHGLPDSINCPEGIYRKSLAIYYVSSPREEAEKHDRALFAPHKEQINDSKIIELIKKRANSETSSEVYRI